jgi:hypothetical protein
MARSRFQSGFALAKVKRLNRDQQRVTDQQHYANQLGNPHYQTFRYPWLSFRAYPPLPSFQKIGLPRHCGITQPVDSASTH